MTSVNVRRDLADALLSLMGRGGVELPYVKECIDEALKDLVPINERTLQALGSREIPQEILERVYRRGWALWEAGSKLTKHQHAFNRVNSFIAGGKARRLDKDLAGMVGTWAAKKAVEKIAPGADPKKVIANAKKALGWLR